ncbi:copper transporter 1-like [Papaver somniferum]|uniref:copper transporter 1-like n=1 Tax=Papaver somniferum TaxID=3469 RepID=UPI000E6FB4E5|nr:copper transporter 1-like [Papaver somniferum]
MNSRLVGDVVLFNNVLFNDWPGNSTGMYVLSLVVVFVLSLLVEWLGNCSIVRADSAHAAAGIVRSIVHTVRVGLAYLVMLGVMSFNGGIFIVAFLGHGLGYFAFGSQVFIKTDNKNKTTPDSICAA